MIQVKTELHPRNKHRGPYDFQELKKCCPDLTKFVAENSYGNESIDFTDPLAVKTLNKALLKFFYNITWDIPEHFLCPPIPGRADYIHYLADLIVDKGNKIRVIDVGVGANCIYPLIGHREYGWNFVGTDIDPQAISIATDIVSQNNLEEAIEIRLQKSSRNIFQHVLSDDSAYNVSMCNPPFHATRAQALLGTQRKWKNLKVQTKALNFGGRSNELWCPGGEVAFIKQMIEESAHVNCQWFTTLVSKANSLIPIYQALEKLRPKEIRTIDMGQGQKKSRFVAWTFM